jgi:CRISPR-associated protein (TIGR03986 family)
MIPKHTPAIPKTRTAIAPYNFVPLPDKVVPAEELQAQNTYHSHRHTGSIVCELTTDSPLYVRCGLTPEQLRQGMEAKELSDFFYTISPDLPAIPGSSLRGMLRTLVEIASYGKMDRVTDRPRYFFRAVAAKSDDPLGKPYRELFKNVRAGYLVKQGNAWYIQPAKDIDGTNFIKVKEQYIDARRIGLIRLRDPNYRPQYIKVSFTYSAFTDRRRQRSQRIDKIDLPGVFPDEGWLITSGSMLETGKPGARTQRTSHCVVPLPDGPLLKIDDQAIADYRAGLTEFQKGPTDIKSESERPFSETDGVLKHDRPVFYCEPPRGESEVRFFGHSPNFRIPYWRADRQRAATPADFVPDYLQDPAITDLAEAIFGYVRPDKQKQGEQARAGRVFVNDAQLLPGQHDVLYPTPVTPQILGSPKPTTFQHYLVQQQADQVQTGTDRRGRPVYQLPLAHYGSATPEETVIRGHKLYWHKGEVGLDAIRETDQEKIARAPKQYTQFRPVKPRTKFNFTIRFENLSQVELGALLWVLRIAADENYRLKLGMGKPLGMGAVKITSTVHLSDRVARYGSLFDGDTWATGEKAMPEPVQAACITEFEKYVLKHSDEKATRLEDALRIQCLLALLKWPGPFASETRYMQIEPQNEYRNRPVLPSPLQVTGIVETPQSQQPTIQPDAQPRRPDKRQTSASTSGTPPRSSEPEIPSVGTVFTGLVLERDETAVLIEVPRFNQEQVIGILRVEADTPKWTPGKDRARVEVTGVRQQGKRMILELKRGAKAQKS